MVALNFPDSPTDGQEYGGYVYDATVGAWNRLPTLPALDLVEFSAVAPSNPQDGQFWFDTNAGKMYIYYNDGSSAQWVSTLGGLASQTGTEGQFLIHDGTEWLASEFTSPGSVLQVVSTTKTDTYSESLASQALSTNLVTGLTASITPKSANSKILVSVSLYGAHAAALYGILGFAIRRDGTAVSIGDSAGSRTGVTGQAGALGQNPGDQAHLSANYLDTPNTTSETTYGVSLHNRHDGTITLYVNRSADDGDVARIGRSTSSITLIEVAG